MSPVIEKALGEGRSVLTPEEARAYLEEQVRDQLDMSLDEFVRRAEAGDLPDHPAIPHLVLLAGVRSPGC
jgi:hypothetical protein